ncbi:NAD(P)-binding protein [Xylariomycetidae sp. FL2044]|nr:NAD(P)-binding protein [Xylariomycetidae sp. FL2044]
MNLHGNALVIGGASGIGQACAEAFAKDGARGVLIGDLNLDAARDVAVRCRAIAKSPDFQAEAVQIDVTSQEAVELAAGYMVKAFGSIDYCVNTAGIAILNFAEIADVELEQFKRLQDVHVNGTFLVLRTISSIMRNQPLKPVDASQPGRGASRGAIVTMGSIASFSSVHKCAQYVTAKHAIVGLTKAAALDNIKHNIRVNCVCPSFTDTPMTRGTDATFAPDARKTYLASLPMGRLATPEEIADAVLFLCSPRASWVTGTAFLADGGMGLVWGSPAML